MTAGVGPARPRPALGAGPQPRPALGAGPQARPALGSGHAVLAAAAGLAVLAGPAAQLGFAALAIGVVGMAHGASDLAVVAPARRGPFLACYLGLAAVCLAWWVLVPALALPLFLIASAVHFGMEDAPAGSLAERAARGLALVAAPAALHGGSYAAILALAGGLADPAGAALALGLAGAAAAAGCLLLAARRGDAQLAAGTAALLLLPPLVGFAVGFLVLHALPQTAARCRQLGLAGWCPYLAAVWPVLAAALALLAAAALLVLRLEPSGVRSLFAGIAALATPHLLVTPWFERRGVGRPTTLAFTG